MRIISFPRYIEDIAQRHQLNDSILVIDGQNVLYKFYVQQGLQFQFGSESNLFADCLKEYLSMFKKANVKCYFVFKGGDENFEDKFNKKRDTDKSTGNLVSGSEPLTSYNSQEHSYFQPIFMKDVYTQVLDEMGFDYVICEYESKKEIIALAQKLNCPVCSYDIEFFFSGIPYVLYPSIEYNQDENKMTCSIITLDSFLQRFKLTDSLLAIFIVLTDRKIFPENHFMDFIKSLKIPIGNYKRNIGILQWLSRSTREGALAHIFKYTSSETKTKFLEEEIYAMSMIRRQETTGLPTEYLLNGKVHIKERDPQWFEKGVISKHIAIPYINLYHSNIFLGSWAIADKEAHDAILPSMKIIKYAYNLLTNFEKEGFIFTLQNNKEIQCRHLIFLRSNDFLCDFLEKDESMPVTETHCVQKPNFNAIGSPFENGWDHVKKLGLFEHFVKESLQGFDFGLLQQVPENAKLLIIALVYHHHQKPNSDASNEACCLLLSYVALSLLNDDGSNKSSPNHSITDAEMINSSDKRVAMNILAPFFKEVTKNEADMIFDSKLIRPLVEFQHCLEQLNFLNQLCGYSYVPTVYSKTFNGTFVYTILYTIQNECEGNCLEFLKQLNPSASVLEFFNGLFASYKALITKMKI